MGITRTWRGEAPSSYSLKLVGYSEVKGKSYLLPYESAVFTASGYQWRLVLYPFGNDKDGGKNHVSVYVRLETLASDLPRNWEMHVDLKFFVFDQNHKKYLTVQDGIAKRYCEDKRELGLAQLIELSMLENQKNGYLVSDTCVFGVDIFVLKLGAKELETLTFVHNPPNNKFTWKILHLSSLNDRKFVLSDEFLIGQRYWRLKIYPEGGQNTPSAFLLTAAHLPNVLVTSSYAMFKLRILNQQNSNHIEALPASAFYAVGSELGYGRTFLIDHKDLYDESKGFLVNDSIILEVEVLCVNETQVISN